MENATKALLIAGTILIAVILIATAVYLYSLFSKQSNEYNTTISAVELEKFNSKFDIYVGRNDISPQEIASLVSLAKQYGNKVNIYIGWGLLRFTPSYTAEDFMKDKQGKTFSCTLVTFGNINPAYDSNGKIIRLRFTQN